MGCLVLLLLTYLFRGAIFGLLAWLVGAVLAVLAFLLNLGFWGYPHYPCTLCNRGGV